jgi:hypothetical protein
MKHALLLLLICLFTSPITITHAQDDDTPSGWPIEERCIGNHTPPPSDWTFDGTIMMTGRHGVHAYQQDWETPRVVSFVDCIDLSRAGLSPDQSWYACPQAHRTFHIDTWVITEGINVYSTVDYQEAYHYPWQLSYSISHGFPITQMYWLDNSRILYWLDGAERPISGEVVLNPFDRTIVQWEGQLTDIVQFGRNGARIVSPDRTRTIVHRPFSGLEDGLYDVMSGEMLTELDLSWGTSVYWMPDSSHFITGIGPSSYTENSLSQLVLFDRDGNVIDIIHTYDENTVVGGNSAWSSDGRYLSFNIGERESYIGYLHIADMQERRIINTCLTEIGSGAAWSPDSTQLALLTPGDGIQSVLVLDIEAYTLHPVARHDTRWSGAIIGWRESE